MGKLMGAQLQPRTTEESSSDPGRAQSPRNIANDFVSTFKFLWYKDTMYSCPENRCIAVLFTSFAVGRETFAETITASGDNFKATKHRAHIVYAVYA